MAIYTNLFIDQGTDYTTTLIVEGVNNSALDLTEYEVFGQVRKSPSSLTFYDLNPQIVNPTLGLIGFGLTDTQSDSMKPGRYVFDVEAVSSLGKRTRIVEGQIEITPGVTRNE